MARPSVVVRRLDASSETAFADLWVDSRVAAGGSSEAASRQVTNGSVAAALARPEIHVLVAEIDHVPAGFVILSDRGRNILTDSPSVSIELVHVLDAHRKAGVGKSLLAAAARYADRAGSAQLECSVPAQNRDLNRYLARLGFAPDTMRRVVSSAVLQRRIAGERDTPKHSLEAVLARRRNARARTTQSTTARAAL